MTWEHDHQPSNRTKRHARLRHVDLGHSLWVDNDVHWNLMLQNRSSVICERPGCGGPLVPNDHKNKRRYLSYWPNSGGCGHHDGPLEEAIETDRRMSERHRWMQNYITELCRGMGYEAMPEQELVGSSDNRVGARADIWIEPTRIAVEVQQRPTNFKERTAARTLGGATQTIWLISHDAGRKADKALFNMPAARFTVLDSRLPYRDRWAVEFEPWRDSKTFDEFARVGIRATTWEYIDEPPYLRTCKLDLQTFLRQVLEGRRLWVSRDPALGRTPRGDFKSGWVLHHDLDNARKRIARDEQITQQAQNEPPQTVTGTDAAIAAPASPPVLPSQSQPPTPHSTPPVPRAVSASPPAALQPMSPDDTPPPADTDWDLVTAALKLAAGVITVLVLLAIGYFVVNVLVHEVSSWWTSLTHGSPTRLPDEQCGPYCRY